jgi:hypothetical protein
LKKILEFKYLMYSLLKLHKKAFIPNGYFSTKTLHKLTLEDKHIILRMYLHSLWNRARKAHQRLTLLSVLKLVQSNYIFSDNIHMDLPTEDRSSIFDMIPRKLYCDCKYVVSYRVETDIILIVFMGILYFWYFQNFTLFFK